MWSVACRWRDHATLHAGEQPFVQASVIALKHAAAHLCPDQAEISARGSFLAALTCGVLVADGGTALQANAGEQPYTGGTASLEQAARTPANPLSSLLATFGKRKLLLK